MSEYSEEVERILLDHFNRHYRNSKVYPWNPDGKASIEERIERFAHSREGFLAEQLLQPLGKRLIQKNEGKDDSWMIVPIEGDEKD